MKEQITEEQIRGSPLSPPHGSGAEKAFRRPDGGGGPGGPGVPTSPFFWHGSEWDTCISLILTGWTFPT